MNVLIVAADKGGHYTPFIEEQIAALEAVGITVSRYAVHGKGVGGYLQEIPRLRQTIRTEHPDIIHAHYGLCGLLAVLSNTLLSTKRPHSTLSISNSQCSEKLNSQYSTRIVTTYHGSDINDKKVLLLSRLAMRWSDWNIFVSPKNIQIALGGIVKHMTHYSLIPCGVDLTNDQLTPRTVARQMLVDTLDKLGIAQDTPFVLFAGAFDNSVKDAPLAKETLQLLAQSSDKVGVPLVELRGYSRHEVNLLMCAANCLLLTSKTEGSPQVVKEAMACGCPIVSVDVGDVRERIEGVDGCYVATSRNPQELSMLLRRALGLTLSNAFASARSIRNTRTNGREHLFDMKITNIQVANDILAVYNSLLQ